MRTGLSQLIDELQEDVRIQAQTGILPVDTTVAALLALGAIGTSLLIVYLNSRGKTGAASKVKAFADEHFGSGPVMVSGDAYFSQIEEAEISEALAAPDFDSAVIDPFITIPTLGETQMGPIVEVADMGFPDILELNEGSKKIVSWANNVSDKAKSMMTPPGDGQGPKRDKFITTIRSVSALLATKMVRIVRDLLVRWDLHINKLQDLSEFAQQHLSKMGTHAKSVLSIVDRIANAEMPNLAHLELLKKGIGEASQLFNLARLGVNWDPQILGVPFHNLCKVIVKDIGPVLNEIDAAIKAINSL